MKKNNQLTPKEQLYLEGVLSGKSNQQIANENGVVLGNVKNTLTRVYKKLGYKSRAELIVNEI